VIAGCPLEDRLLSCLAHSYPELLIVSLAVVVGFLLMWRRWAPVLLAAVLAGLLLLLHRWGVTA